MQKIQQLTETAYEYISIEKIEYTFQFNFDIYCPIYNDIMLLYSITL